MLLFLFLKILVRWSCSNEKEYWYALGASFRNLSLKRAKYWAEQYYRKSIGLKQDKQNLVSRRPPFGTPLPIRPCVIRVTFTRTFYHTINQMISVKTLLLKLFWITLDNLMVLPDHYRVGNRGLLSTESFRSTAVPSTSFFISMVLSHQFIISESSVKRLPFLCIDVHDIISIHFTLSYHQENLWDRSRWLTDPTIH